MGPKKVNPNRRRNWLLVVAGCLAVTGLGIGYWQYAFDATMPASPAPMQLKIAAAPAVGSDVAPAAPAKDVEPVAAVKETVNAPTTVAASPKPTTPKAAAAKAPATKPATRVARRDQPAPATVVERPETVVVPSAPKAGKSNAGKSPAETYEAAARVSLEKRDYAQAREQIGLALANGGKATFTIIHDHNRGNFDDPKAMCVGQFTILADELRFEPRDEGDRFAANWADVKDAGSNRFFGSGRGGFHVAINAGGKYKNFNLTPESKDKEEGKLILDLLKSYTRKSDRTK
ncbi:MAG TPA: hypothetical protein VM096_09960 [Vicinamibacterales bacterium]|nr:hypothetical protein [Vicinamibacterales bacterium]